MGTPHQPDPYDIAFEETIAARGHTAFVMRAGQVLRIVDVAGQQVADLICFRLDDHGDKLSVHNTLLLNRTIYITTGHALMSTECTTMMTIVEDTVGVHDLIAGSCSEHTNAVRYGVRGTPSCRTNFEQSKRLRQARQHREQCRATTWLIGLRAALQHDSANVRGPRMQHGAKCRPVGRRTAEMANCAK